jgi:hypothetical protein
MYSCADFCYVLWDIVQNFVAHHKPQCRILLCAMGLVQNFVMCYGSQRRISLSTNGPLCRIIGQSTESHEFYLKLAPTLK